MSQQVAPNPAAPTSTVRRDVASALRADGPQVLVTFAGQGIDFMTELVELHAMGGVAARLIEAAGAVTARVAARPAFVMSGLHEHGYDLLRWIEGPEARPPEAYLQSTAVSIPLIFAAQVARYALSFEEGLCEVFERGGVAGLTGHSQGIVAALLVAEQADGRVDEARFAELVEVLTWEGLHMAQSYHAALAGVGARGEQPPMVAVSGPDLATLEALVARVNRDQDPGHHLVVSLQNGRTRNVVSGPSALMDGLKVALEVRAQRDEASKKAGKLGGRPLRFTWEPLSVGGAYHGPMMGQGAAAMRETIARLGFKLDGAALKHRVFSSDGGGLMNEAADLTALFVDCQFLRPVRWSQTLIAAHAISKYSEIFDYGPADGVARLSAAATRGLGVRVHAQAVASGRVSAWVTPADELEQALSYSRFAPGLRTLPDGSVAIDNLFTRATGRSPAILPGMTPTTVDVPIVAAAANAGYMAELAGGGQVTEAIFRRRCEELAGALEPGQEVVFNGLYLDPYLWDLHIRKAGLVQQLRREGAPICGVTVSAGVPELKEAVALLDELNGEGLWLNAFKPGSVEQIRQVCAIAQAAPQHRVFVHVEGGRAGGHHSWEELEQLLLETYHQLRACENVVLCVGGGIATPERGAELLTGRWALAHGQPAMPVDAILLGTVTMAAREATATRSVKEALVSAAGVGGWVFAGEVKGGVTSGKSQLNADIHYLDNAASRAGRLLDEVAGDAAAVEARRGEIIEALSRTCKPYFGDVERMTYQRVLERMIELMAIGQRTAYEDGCWLDASHRRRVFDLVRRFEARLVAREEGLFEPLLKELGDLDEPMRVLERFVEAYPEARETTLHPLDAEFFIQEVCARPGKPVNFVPVIDAQVRRWYKSDSLWQAQHGRYTADEVLVIPGPEAVSGIGAADEPVADILARYDRALLVELNGRVEAAGGPVEAQRSFGASESAAIDQLASMGLVGPLVTAFEAARVFDGRAMVDNPLRSLCRANSGVLEIVRVEGARLVEARYVTAGGEQVSLSVSGSSVRVEAAPQQVPREDGVVATLGFELLVYEGARGRHVVMDGAAYHGAVQKFYQVALFGRALERVALHEASRVEVEVSEEVARGYARVTQLGGLVPGEVPLPYGFSLAWEAIFGAMSCEELSPGLLRLVHLSNKFEVGEAWPVRVGQRVEAEARVTRVIDTAQGRTIEVFSRLSVGGVSALGITSVFYVRESFAHLPLGRAESVAAEQTSVDIISGDVRDVEGKTLSSVLAGAPGTMVPFSVIGSDRNPIHSSGLMARMAGLDGCIVHGMWTAARAYASLVDDALGGATGRIASFEASFLSPCMPGEQLRVTTRRVGARAGAREVWQVEVLASGSRAVMRAEALIKPPRTAYVFPGQGIQQRGMGMEGYARSRAARAVWDRADAFTRRELGFSILAVVRENPGQLEIRGQRLVHERGVLHLTQLTQVAMSVLSLAQVAELEEAGLLQDDAVVCGHSVGEYNALGSLDGVLPMEVVVRTVYERGLAMHRLVPRDEHGESGYRMGVIRPHYVGMSEQQARALVDDIAHRTGLALEIVNYNIVGRQYSVVGRIESIAALQAALEAMPQRGGQGKSAWVDVPGVDVPFHSRVLSDGVAPFRETLEARFPQELPIERLLGRYIPNLVPRPFSIERAFVAEVQQYTSSAPLSEVLLQWDAWCATPTRLARRLLIELLSWQFASPVRWIETQDLLMRPVAMGGLGVERIVEVGVGYQPTLTNMARYTKELIGAPARAVEVFNCEADADVLFLRDGDAEALVEAAAAAQQAVAAAPATAAAPVVAAPVVAASSGAAVADDPLTVREALRALLAVQARLRPEQLDAKETIDEVFEGVSSRRNQVLLDIGAEFGLGTIDGAHEKPLSELEAEIARRAPRYASAGRYLKATVDEALKHQLGRAGMGRKEALAYLDASWGMGPKIADAALVYLALGRREGDSARGGALAVLGAQAVQDRAGAQAVLDAAAGALGAARGVSLGKRGGAGASGGAVDSAVVDALAERIVGAQGVLMQTARDMAEHLGQPLVQPVPAVQADAAALARLQMLEREHGAEYASMIAPQFDPLKHVAFISPWAWRQRDVARLAYDGLAGRVEASWHKLAGRLANRPSARERESAAWFVRWASARGAAPAVIEALEQIRDAHGERALAWTPTRPALVEAPGALRYEEQEDTAPDARERFVEQLRIGQPGAFVSANVGEADLLKVLKRGCDEGFALRGRVALVTGASPGSIALEMVGHLLHSGAVVVVTTTTYNKNRLRFYRKFYQDHAGEGAELHVVPCNQGSAQDVEALVSWLFSTVTEQAGAKVLVVKRPMPPALVLPFGAIKDLATLDQLGAGAEAATRAMLLNVERLVARIGVRSREHGMPERPCHVVLPLSPNHGAFGGDGAYAETKAALEVLLEKWSSEREAWGEGVTLCGARIGWVRGTGLMQANNLVSPGLEQETGVRTFSSAEMGFLLTALCTDEARDASRLKPLRVDLTGGFGAIEDLKGVVSGIRQRVAAREAALRASEREVQNNLLAALPRWPAATFAQPSWRLPAAPHVAANRVPLEQMVVLVGAGEVGPFGSARTRFAFEVQDELSAAAVLELAWTCGLVRYEAGERGGSWVDGETGEAVAEADIAPRYRERLRERIGIRFIEPDTLGLDPGALPVMSTAYLERDMTFAAASEAEAREFERQDPERTLVSFDAAKEQWRVTRRAGSMVRVPRAVKLNRDVAGVVPRGYDLARYGIPRDMIENTDRLALYNLIATVEAFLSAGMTPEELLARIHPARVANTQGSGIGGMRSLQRLYWDHLLGTERQKDILQETLINVVAAYVVQSYVGSYGAMSHPVAACATAAVSVEEAVDKILANKADLVVAGGFDDIGREGMVGFADMNATANADEMRARGLEPDEFSRANDVRRRGFVEAQGGGTMLLARADVALRLGLPVRAVVGYAASFSDGIQKSIPAPGLGAIACVLGKERSPLALSLARFGLTTDDIAMVYKHDTSTQANDPNENRLHDAIQRYLGRADGNPLWVVSQKTITGHAKGGSAAWQAIGLAQSLAQGVIPGNRNLDAVDPAMAAFEHMAFTDAAIDAGADVLEAGLLTSLGFGHVSGIILLLHPRHFLAQVPHAERAAYLSSVAAREARERQGLVEAMIGRAPLYERRAARRFEGADGSEQQHAEEIALLTELTGRYDLEAGKFTTEEPG